MRKKLGFQWAEECSWNISVDKMLDNFKGTEEEYKGEVHKNTNKLSFLYLFNESLY